MKLKLSFGNAGAQWGVFVLCLLGFTSFPASAAKYPDAVLADGPIAFWSFSETNLSSSTTDFATNSGATGLNFNGTYLNGVTHPVGGALVGSPETGASFDGADDYVSVPFSASLNPGGAFTIEAWIKPGVTLSGTTLTCPLSSVHIASPRRGWLIYQSATGWNFRTFNANTTATAVDITGGGTPA